MSEQSKERVTIKLPLYVTANYLSISPLSAKSHKMIKHT